MIVTVQCVPKRLEYIKPIADKFETASEGVVFNIDAEYKGTYESFRDMLKIPFKDYRLHLQDDIVVAKELHKNLEYLELLMTKNRLDVLSLYANPRKSVVKDYEEGKKLSVLKPFLMLQAVVFSRKAIDIIAGSYDDYGKTHIHDDEVIQLILAKNKIKAYCHLPALVQHNLNLKSLMGHANNKKNRRTPLFKPNYFIQ